MHVNDQGTIDTRLDARISIITLNRPAKLNALTSKMIFAFREALQAAQSDPEILVVLIRGEGKAFCAGDDIAELAGAEADPDQQGELVNALQDVTRQIMLGTKPVIAVVHGWAVGAAFSWVLNCDFVVCAESSKAFFPEVRWGVSPTGGASTLAPKLLGTGRAREAFLLSRRFTARDLLDFGVATRVVTDGEELSEALSMARDLTALPCFALSSVKRLVNQALGELETVLAAEMSLAVVTATSPEVARRLASRISGAHGT